MGPCQPTHFTKGTPFYFILFFSDKSIQIVWPNTHVMGMSWEDNMVARAPVEEAEDMPPSLMHGRKLVLTSKTSA